ncbi:vacuolar protein sorting-associated protein 54 [Panaeolus papilionaceus]|nr:vacuolar protein sorting-associated protein 54 [Panaeolus papilionaceus]
MSDTSSLAPSRPHTPVGQTPLALPTARPYRFTWDPSSRRPGPESVSGTTEGRGGDDFAATPHPFGFLNHSTASLALGSIPPEWSSSRTGFHAISTVLNNPHKRQAPPKAHSSLPTVAPVSLPRVRRKDFETYLQAISPEWERYAQNTQLGQDGHANLDTSQITPRNSLSGDGDSPTTQEPPSIFLADGKSIPPLDTVPEVFFKKEFNLGDPRTFATVTEQDSANGYGRQDHSFADPFSLSHSLPLLEKFSHYADTVEQHLVREISIRSTSFFAALTNLHDLQSESERCLDRVSKLRTELQKVDDKNAKRGLEMVRKEMKMANLVKIRDGVQSISGVVEMTGVIKGLVHAGQWGQALEIIEELENLWEDDSLHEESTSALPTPTPKANGTAPHPSSKLDSLAEEHDDDHSSQQAHNLAYTNGSKSHRPHKIPLGSLEAFSNLPNHLRTLTMEIAASLSSELVSLLRNDLQTRREPNRKPEPDADQGLKDRLKPLLLNVVRTNGLKEAMLSWREAVLADIKGIMKTVLPAFELEGEETDGSEARAGLANHLREMHHTEFIVLIQRVYRTLFNASDGLQTQVTMIQEVLKNLGPSEVQSFDIHLVFCRSQTPQKSLDTNSIDEDLQDVLASATVLSSAQAGKVITYRTEQHTALELQDFLTFFNDSWAYLVKCEQVAKGMMIEFRGAINNQAKLYLKSYHEVRMSRSAKLVEDELWKPLAEVTPGLQRIVNALVDSAIRDPPELVIKTEDTIFSPYAANFSLAVTPNGTPAPTSALDSSAAPSFTTALDNSHAAAPANSRGVVKHLKVEDRSYYIVSATAEVLTLLQDYLRLVVNLPGMTMQALTRTIEFLKTFNSRVCQMVLGAGAMRSAGLKNISARHLALASQSLSVISDLIPYVRETFRRHLNQHSSTMLVEFDKLKRDYQDHQNEIHSKLVTIMGDRLDAHIKLLRTIDWSDKQPTTTPNKYMSDLVDETEALHRIVSRYLPKPITEYVLSQVFAAINHRLSEEYNTIELPHPEAKARLLEDARYLHRRLGALKNVTAPTGMLETVVSEKGVPRSSMNNVPRASAPSSPSPPTRSNTMSANQRLQSLLSSRASTDKALPIPDRTATPPPVPPTSDKPRSPSMASQVYSGTLSNDSLSQSQLSLSMRTSPPVQPIPTRRGSGFMQVERSASPLSQNAASSETPAKHLGTNGK